MSDWPKVGLVFETVNEDGTGDVDYDDIRVVPYDLALALYEALAQQIENPDAVDGDAALSRWEREVG